MCGIIAIAGTSPVTSRLIDGLKTLEYRGYDSAGIAVINNGEISRVRSSGKIINLENKLVSHTIDGTVGIGHTRWATHGAPVENNAHPHMSDNVALVHNGIIENYIEIKEICQSRGCIFNTQTDTEVIVHLLSLKLKEGFSPKEALIQIIKYLRGAYALAVLFKGYDDIIGVVRNGPPLAIGYGDNEMFIGSDALSLAPFTNNISYLEDGDIGIIQHNKVVLFNSNGESVERKIVKNTIENTMISKGNYRHFMEKEIYEQPEATSHSLANYVDFSSSEFKKFDNTINWLDVDNISFTCCGTAYYSTLVAKYWFEKYARITVDNDVASEFRYRDVVFKPNSLAIFVSQSGETADTLASLRYCKSRGIKTAVVVNVIASTMAREADYVFPTLCGPEIGVASTKAFTSQLSVLLILALKAGYDRGKINKDQLHKYLKELVDLPSHISKALKLDHEIQTLAQGLGKTNTILYLGRGVSYPIALEGALKLKELSYIHAEGYAAGELKHGPIALIDDTVPTIVVAPFDKWFEKTISNVQEVIARGGSIIMLTDEVGAREYDTSKMKVLILPKVSDLISPILYAVPIQLLAYHTALALGTDVDQPRNLAKSVTVE